MGGRGSGGRGRGNKQGGSFVRVERPGDGRRPAGNTGPNVLRPNEINPDSKRDAAAGGKGERVSGKDCREREAKKGKRAHTHTHGAPSIQSLLKEAAVNDFRLANLRTKRTKKTPIRESIWQYFLLSDVALD